MNRRAKADDYSNPLHYPPPGYQQPVLSMTPQAFIAKWGPGGPSFGLNERQSAQPHFIDLCQPPGVPLTGSARDHVFEQDTLVLGAAHQAPGMAVAPACGWSDYPNSMPDEEILKRLPALNLERSANPKTQTPA